jgi:hypothetical protein
LVTVALTVTCRDDCPLHPQLEEPGPDPVLRTTDGVTCRPENLNVV